jgi:hypothetical protein
MRVRVLLEQEPVRARPDDRHYIASGDEVDIADEWALELIGRGEAEAMPDEPATEG